MLGSFITLWVNVMPVQVVYLGHQDAPFLNKHCTTIIYSGIQRYEGDLYLGNLDTPSQVNLPNLST